MLLQRVVCHWRVLELRGWIHSPGPVFTKLFRIRIKIRLKLKILLLWIVFKTYHNYLAIVCLYLIKYVLQTRLLGILSFFMKEKVNLIVATVMQIWAHLITGYILVKLIVSNINFNIMHLRSKTTLTMSMYTTIKFSWTDNGN